MNELDRDYAEEMTKDFTFAHVQEGFDSHIGNSIRGYEQLHDDVVSLSRYFVEDYSCVVDVGSSTGKTLEAMIAQNHKFAPNAEYVGIENAIGFKKSMEDRVFNLKKTYNAFVDFEFEDVRGYKFKNCSLVTSLFTLQFMPMNSRENVIKEIYNGLNKGGAFIFSEKLVAESARVQEMFTFNYYDFKKKNFTEKEIMDKEVTLRNMLKPNSRQEIMYMLTGAGFKNINTFWQNHLFVGFLAIKD
jgi:tRNA (cmo5U34)-methyltransferase